MNPDAAGIDIGATEIYVAVPPDRDPEPVRMFESFTQDLNALADWLEQCRVRSVAMESTGVYWIPLAQIFGKSRFRNLSRERQTRQEGARPPNGCVRLPMVTTPAFCWVITRLVSSSTARVCASIGHASS